MRAGFTSLSAPGGLPLLHTHTGGFKAEPESCAVTEPWLVSELMQAGSFQRSINITKAPFKPSVYYCCFQEHTQFTIWPGTLCAPSLMQINIVPLIAGMLMLLTPRHRPAEQASASSAPRWHASSNDCPASLRDAMDPVVLVRGLPCKINLPWDARRA